MSHGETLRVLDESRVKRIRERKAMVMLLEDVESIVFMTADGVEVGRIKRDENGKAILDGVSLNVGPRIVKIYYR